MTRSTRKQDKTTAYVEDNVLHLNNGDTIEVGSPEWFAWLDRRQIFYFDSEYGRLHARAEERFGRWYWYAYRYRDGKLRKQYLGKSEAVNLLVLNRTSRRLAIA